MWTRTSRPSRSLYQSGGSDPVNECLDILLDSARCRIIGSFQFHADLFHIPLSVEPFPYVERGSFQREQNTAFPVEQHKLVIDFSLREYGPCGCASKCDRLLLSILQTLPSA